VDPRDVGGGGSPAERRRLRHHPADQVDLFERAGGAALVHEGGRHVGRPELASHQPLLHPGQVGVDLLEAVLRIHPGEVAPGSFPEHFGQIVVSVDHRDRPVKHSGPGEESIGGLGGGRLGQADDQQRAQDRE